MCIWPNSAITLSITVSGMTTLAAVDAMISTIGYLKIIISDDREIRAVGQDFEINADFHP